MMKTIAVLNDNNILVGFKKVVKAKKTDIEMPDDCDLDTNEKYRWDKESKSFIPRGMLYPKVRVPKTSQETAIFLLMNALVKGTPIPAECEEYVDWYAKNIKSREDEVNSWRNKQ